MTISYDNEEERKRHLGTIQMLAVELHMSLEQVRPVYEIELNKLMTHARIRDFLPVLTRRQVREVLREHIERVLPVTRK